MSLASSDPKRRIPITALRVMGERAYGLTAKQETFCLNYAAGNITQTEAARRAGFSNPAFAASRFLNGRDYPHVLRRIVELKHELSRRFEVTFENHVKKLAEMRDMALADKNYSAAIAAEKNRGQVAGLYIARHEIMIGKIDQMSREEVLAEIEKLHQEYPALAANPAPKQDLSLIEDVTFEEVLEPVPDEVGHEPDRKEPEHRGRSLEEPPSRDDEGGPLDEDRSPRRRWHPRP
jgi:hypothetical protein